MNGRTAYLPPKEQIRFGEKLWFAFGSRPGWRSYWCDVAYDVLKGIRPVRHRLKPFRGEEERGEVEGWSWVLIEL